MEHTHKEGWTNLYSGNVGRVSVHGRSALVRRLGMAKPTVAGLPVLALVGFGVVLTAMALTAAGSLPVAGLIAVCGAAVGLAHGR